MGVVFESERFRMRDWIPDLDAQVAFEIYGDPEVCRYLPIEPMVDVDQQHERLVKACERYSALTDGSGFWAIEEKATGQVLGVSLVKHLPLSDGGDADEVEVGWTLKRTAWGRGVATESARAAIAYAFDRMGIDAIYAVVFPGNSASVAVTRRLGMEPKGRVSRYYNADLELFSLAKSSFTATV